jgi:hypothetical protein
MPVRPAVGKFRPDSAGGQANSRGESAQLANFKLASAEMESNLYPIRRTKGQT